MTPEQTRQELQAKARVKLAASGIDAPIRQPVREVAGSMRTTNILLTIILVLMLTCIGWVAWKYLAFKAVVNRIDPQRVEEMDKLGDELQKMAADAETKRAAGSARLHAKMRDQ